MDPNTPNGPATTGKKPERTAIAGEALISMTAVRIQQRNSQQTDIDRIEQDLVRRRNQLQATTAECDAMKAAVQTGQPFEVKA